MDVVGKGQVKIWKLELNCSCINCDGWEIGVIVQLESGGVGA